MFYRSFSLLASLARGASLPTPRAFGGGADVSAAMSVRLDTPPLSERLRAPGEYRDIQRERRRALEALIRIEADEARLARALDLLCALCEESRWSENPAGEPFDDDAHPDIDFQAAETAVLLGWTARALGDRLTTRASGKLLYEVRRRVFSPFLAHDDYPFMRGRGHRPLTILSDILLAALLLEHSEQRRTSILKQALRQLDQAVASRSDRVEALADAAAETGAVTDLTELLCRATQGRVDLRPTYPTQAWLDQLLFPWLEGECFCDPAGGGMTPALSGAELYRVARAADDDALMALGARLHRLNPRPSATVTGRMMDALCAADLSAEGRKAPRIRSAATPRNRVMVSRFSGMTCAVHTGGDAANAGGMALFCDGRPVLIEAPGAANLPRVAGRGQLSAPELGCEAEFRPAQDRDILSVDLTHAWIPGLVRMCQRTAMIDRAEALLRLVDAFELEEAAALSFRFHTPIPPERLPGGLRLGPVDLTWEGDLLLRAEPLPGEPALYRIELTTPAPVSRGIFTFIFARGQ